MMGALHDSFSVGKHVVPSLFCLHTFLLLPVVFTAIVLASDDEIPFLYDDLFDDLVKKFLGKTDSDDERPIRGRDPLQCASDCVAWTNCSSFFHNVFTNECRLQRFTYPYQFNEATRQILLEAQPGWRYFRYNNESCPVTECYYEPRQLPGFCFTVFYSAGKSPKQAMKTCGRNMGRLAQVDTPQKFSWLKGLLDTEHNHTFLGWRTQSVAPLPNSSRQVTCLQIQTPHKRGQYRFCKIFAERSSLATCTDTVAGKCGAAEQ